MPLFSLFSAAAEQLALRTDPQRVLRWLDRLPASAFEAMRRQRFQHTLRLAAERSAFYRDQFHRRGIDVRRIEHPAQLADFYTTGEDLRARPSEDFLTGRPDTAFETTGTTSPIPKRVFFSRREIEEMGRITAVWLRLLGLRRDDRVVSAFDCSFWVSPWVLRAGVEHVGCFLVEAGKIDPAEFYERAQTYRPTVLFGEPSWIVRLSEMARGRGAWPLKFLFAGGENMSESTRALVEAAWNAPLYLNYGQTESFGALGGECRMKRGYHRNDFSFFFEIRDPDPDGYGELVYTTLTRDAMPLIRYRSTDVSRLVDDACECGVPTGRIAKIRSRCDEMIVCGMGNIGPWVFDELLRDVPGVGDEWQVRVDHERAVDIVGLHVEMADLSVRDAADTAIRDRLRRQLPDFWRNLEMGLYELRVIRCAPGSLRGDGRKLRRLVDGRPMVSAEPLPVAR